MLFAESDASGTEGDPAVTAPIRVEGDNEASFTVMAIPLTVTQYQSEPDTYGNSCDTTIAATSTDPAEGESTAQSPCVYDGVTFVILSCMHIEDDFSATPVVQMVSSDATDATGRFEFDVSISLQDDTIQEPAEYFLLVLSVQQNGVDTIRTSSGRQCIRVKIATDQDGG